MKIVAKRFSLLACVLALGCLMGCPAAQTPGPVGVAPFYPGTTTSLLPNYAYPPMVFTATSQTVAQALSGQSFCTIEFTAATATTVTWSFKGSNDGGTNYYALGVAPYVAGTLVPTTTAVTNSAATSALYVVNVAALTNFEIVTSSTFTATGVKFYTVCTSNAGLVMNIG